MYYFAPRLGLQVTLPVHAYLERGLREGRPGEMLHHPPPREHAYIKSRTGATKSVPSSVASTPCRNPSRAPPSLQRRQLPQTIPTASLRPGGGLPATSVGKRAKPVEPESPVTKRQAPRLRESRPFLPREVAPKPRVAPTLPTLVERHLAKHGTSSPTRQGMVTRTEPGPPICIRWSVKSTTFTGSSSVRPRVSTRVCEECVREQLTALLQLQRKRRRYLRECIRRSGHTELKTRGKLRPLQLPFSKTWKSAGGAGVHSRNNRFIRTYTHAQP